MPKTNHSQLPNKQKKKGLIYLFINPNTPKETEIFLHNLLLKHIINNDPILKN